MSTGAMKAVTNFANFMYDHLQCTKINRFSALWLECGKIYAKNPQQKNAVLALKTYCDSHG